MIHTVRLTAPPIVEDLSLVSIDCSLDRRGFSVLKQAPHYPRENRFGFPSNNRDTGAHLHEFPRPERRAISPCNHRRPRRMTPQLLRDVNQIGQVPFHC